MKCLSVRQPWAWAIIHGGKDVENRNWYTSFRGTLAIHAGKSFDMNRGEWASMSTGRYGEPWHSMARGYNLQAYHVLGAIIGTVEVYDCVPDHRCDSAWKADGYEFYCWLLRNPQALKEPIPWKGRLGLFDAPDILEAPE